jgi:arylsulfatase
MYSTDNGAECLAWPDGGKPRRSAREEHELGRRLPRAVRHPLARRDQARHDHNDIFSHEDMLPTLLAAAGVPT